jgi:tetratricopeptide (TPR) repeat protein
MVALYIVYWQSNKIASQNFELAVTSAQKVLDELSTAVDRGDITINGATYMLNVAGGIVAQAHDVESTTKTVGLLIRLADTASDIYATLGNYTQAYQSAKEASDSAEKLRVANPDDPEVLKLLYASTWRMGDAIALGGLGRATDEQSLTKYLEAEKLAHRLVSLAPDDTSRQRDLMSIYQKIGDVRQAMGDPGAAIAEYRQALTLIQNAVAKAPTDRRWLRDLASTLRRLGQALASEGDFNGALDQSSAALKIMTDLAQEDAGDDVVQSNLASIHRDIATVYANRDEFDLALAEYQRAIAIQQRLIAKDPANAYWQLSLASFYTGAGGVLRRQGDLPRALDQFRRAYNLRQSLALKDPANPGRQRSLAFAAISVADLLKAQKQNLDESEKLYREAIEILDELRPRYDRDVFDCYIKIGDILMLQNDWEGALKEYKLAWAIARDAAAKDPSAVGWQQNLVTSYDKIGDLLAAQGRSAEAVEQYQQALDIVTAPAASYPKSDAESLKTKIQALKP